MKSKILATMALIAISVLSGCGKSNNNAPAATYGVGGAFVGGANGQGGCYDLRNAQGGIQVAFSGYNQSYSGGVIGTLAASTSIAGGGYAYTSNRGTGDQLTVYVNGGSQQYPGGGGQMAAVAHLGANTVAYIQYYGGGMVCGLRVNSNIGAGNVLTSSSYLYGGYGLMNISI